jgi:hypothetical protein
MQVSQHGITIAIKQATRDTRRVVVVDVQVALLQFCRRFLSRFSAGL